MTLIIGVVSRRYFSGNSVITRAIRPIAKGELIPENYGPCYSTKAKTQRKLQLVDRYWFDCQCEVSSCVTATGI